MINKGRVIEINNDGVIIYVLRASPCGDNCVACGSCEKKEITVKAYCDFPVKNNDIVEFESNSNYIYLGLLLVFIFPVVLPLLVYFAFSSYSVTLGIVLAAACFAAYCIVIFFLSKSAKFIKNFSPKVTSIINK